MVLQVMQEILLQEVWSITGIKNPKMRFLTIMARRVGVHDKG